MNIKPISDLRNYPTVLADVKNGSPVYLTKNGYGCYVIVDISEQEEHERKAAEFDRMETELKLLRKLFAEKVD